MNSNSCFFVDNQKELELQKQVLSEKKNLIKSRKRKSVIPNESKNKKYYTKRKKNNIAAKKSRDKKNQIIEQNRSYLRDIKDKNLKLRENVIYLEKKLCLLTNLKKELKIEDINSLEYHIEYNNYDKNDVLHDILDHQKWFTN